MKIVAGRNSTTIYIPSSMYKAENVLMTDIEL